MMTALALQMTFLQMVAQFFGGVLTAWFIIDKWQYGAYWYGLRVVFCQSLVFAYVSFGWRACRYLWGFCSFIPAVAELTLLVLTFGFKYVEY